MRDVTSTDDLALCRRVMGWHTEPFVDVFLEVLRDIDESVLKDCRVLEIGASRGSAISLFFLFKGSYVDITAQQTSEVRGITNLVRQETKHLPVDKARVRVFPLDANAIPERAEYDIIIMKGVLGGLDRSHDLRRLAGVLVKCSEALKKGGHLIILDKGYASGVHNVLLRRYGAAGRNNWHYFTDSEIKSILPCDGTVSVFWAGFLSIGVMPNKWLQRLVDFTDRAILHNVFKDRGTVFGAVYTKRGSAQNEEGQSRERI